ncbi:hypothetical protein Tco_0712905 [Tanacetum coccineum]
MASESTSSQQSSHLSPSSKVKFKCEDGIIAFNNAVALLEHTNDLYYHMLGFLSNCCISNTLTIQPSTIYVEYIREFWYTAKVDEATKTITFSLSSIEKPLTFTQDEFITDIGLPICSNTILLPPKETVGVRLATLEPEPPLIISYEKVNADDTADKSSSMTSVQPVRVILSKTQVAENQHAEETVDIVDATKRDDTERLIMLDVQDQNIHEEVKEFGLESIEDVTFDQIMDEIDQKNKAAEKPESPFDIESEIKIIKRRIDDSIELHTLNTKVDQLESSISKKVTDDIQSFVPSIVVDALKANLSGLLSEALKNTLPQMFKDFIQQSVQESIEEKLPLFVTLQQELSKVIKNKLGVSVKNRVHKGMQAVSNKLASVQSTVATNSQHVHDLRLMFKDMVFLLEATEVFKKANAEGEEWEKNNPETPTEEKDAQNPDQTHGEQRGRYYG